jgi:hypothetical protein
VLTIPNGFVTSRLIVYVVIFGFRTWVFFRFEGIFSEKICEKVENLFVYFFGGISCSRYLLEYDISEHRPRL